MISIRLTCRYDEHNLREPVAWYLAGDDPRTWLEQIARWTVSHKSLRLLPVPRSRTDRRPMGLLAVSSGAKFDGASKRCLPFGRVGKRLFLPINARIEPEVTEQELQSLLSTEFTYVWHPACGLVAFEESDVLSVADFLTAEPPSDRRWDRAVTGVALSKRLVSLSPEVKLTLELVLEEGQDDIGSDSDSLDALPRSPIEPGKGLGRAVARQGTRLLANVVQWFAQHAPATASRPTWVNKLGDWAERQLAGIAAGLSASRNKQIARLMHMLETDPDRGLRFALPLSGDAHRGLSLGDAQLMERNVDFNLGSLGGGRAASFWNVPGDYHLRLTSLYRELANREIRLGRHRRAAYIFAELLGDFDAAANALASGHHWREAAVIYRKRLNRPLDAAECLEQGGLWTEAIALYQELEYHEKAGDLFRELDQQEDAEEEYRKEALKHQNGRDFLSAARIFEEKLFSADEALEILALGWPVSSQAGQCLRQVFQIHSRLGRHDASMTWIDRLRREHHPSSADALAAETLADLVNTYPDAQVKLYAADSTRVIVSQRLDTAILPDQRRLLSAIRRLVPEDRLLDRDCHRYLQPPTPRIKPPAARPRVPRQGLQLVHTIRLPRGMGWCAATTSGKAIYAVGINERTLVAVRSGWGRIDLPGVAWTLDKSLSQPSVILSAAPHGDSHVLLHVVGEPPLVKVLSLQPSDQFPELVQIGSTKGISSSTLAAARSQSGLTWIVEPRSGELCTIAIGSRGEQISTEVIPNAQWPHPFVWQEAQAGANLFQGALHARNNKVYLGVGNRVMVLGRSQPSDYVDITHPVLSLVGSAPHTRTRVAATFECGGEVFWDDFEETSLQPFASGMPEPIACFNRAGYLVAACEGGCEVYSTQDRQVRLVADTKLSGPRPVAVLSGPNTGQFGIVTPNGEIRVYEVCGP